jgi:ComEC/Rec2-related protein
VFPLLARRIPRPQAAGAAALLGALAYAAVAGFALPTVRTVLMIAVVVLARLARRHVRIVDTLALAMLAVLLFDPLSLLAAGFWLSFGGVAWLAWCLPASMHWAKAFLPAQGVATVGLLPFTAVLFGQASLAGPVANLAAIPWWSLVVVPLSLFGTGLEALWRRGRDMGVAAGGRLFRAELAGLRTPGGPAVCALVVAGKPGLGAVAGARRRLLAAAAARGARQVPCGAVVAAIAVAGP